MKVVNPLESLPELHDMLLNAIEVSPKKLEIFTER